MKIIGRTDKVSFPEWDIHDLDAKIDTGAYTSAIHCHDIIEENQNGEQVLKFKLLDPSHPDYNDRELISRDYKIRHIRSSNGIVESRFSIKTTVIIFKKKYKIELSLSERSSMKNPVLLGRKFLNRKFMVDPSKKNLSHDM